MIFKTETIPNRQGIFFLRFAIRFLLVHIFKFTIAYQGHTKLSKEQPYYKLAYNYLFGPHKWMEMNPKKFSHYKVRFEKKNDQEKTKLTININLYFLASKIASSIDSSKRLWTWTFLNMPLMISKALGHFGGSIQLMNGQLDPCLERNQYLWWHFDPCLEHGQYLWHELLFVQEAAMIVLCPHVYMNIFD